MADKFWQIQIAVNDDVVRRHHELTPEDPETDQTLVSDWLSDLVIDARKAHEFAQGHPGPDCAAAANLEYGRVGSMFLGQGNLVFLRADRIDDLNAANSTPDTVHDARPETD